MTSFSDVLQHSNHPQAEPRLVAECEVYEGVPGECILLAPRTKREEDGGREEEGVRGKRKGRERRIEEEGRGKRKGREGEEEGGGGVREARDYDDGRIMLSFCNDRLSGSLRLMGWSDLRVCSSADVEIVE